MHPSGEDTRMGRLETRLLSLGALIAALSWLKPTATGVAAETWDGTWRGQMTCAKLSFTKGSQNVPVEVVISGRRVTFARKVWNQDNSSVVGTEEGSGEVDANGEIRISSVWKSTGANPHFTFNASYLGSLQIGAGSLNGTQVWTFDGKTENRGCSLSLKR
jgi:hypothetical protein